MPGSLGVQVQVTFGTTALMEMAQACGDWGGLYGGTRPALQVAVNSEQRSAAPRWLFGMWTPLTSG